MQLNGDVFNNVGNRAGRYRFSWQTYGPGSARSTQQVSITRRKQYTCGFWISKKSSHIGLTLDATWSDNAGEQGVLYHMPESETIFPIYGTRQDQTFTPSGTQVTLNLQMRYTGSEFAAFHLDEFWLVEVATPTPSPVSAFELR